MLEDCWRLPATLPIFMSREQSLHISSTDDVELFGARAGRAVNVPLSGPTGAHVFLRRRMLKELGNLIRGSHSTSERECKRCSPDIQLIALEALHACTLSGSSRPTDFLSKVLKKCGGTTTGHIRVPNTSSCPECKRPGAG